MYKAPGTILTPRRCPTIASCLSQCSRASTHTLVVLGLNQMTGFFSCLPFLGFLPFLMEKCYQGKGSLPFSCSIKRPHSCKSEEFSNHFNIELLLNRSRNSFWELLFSRALYCCQKCLLFSRKGTWLCSREVGYCQSQLP